MERVFLGCHYCKAQFWLKNELYFHWYQSCTKYCPCDNCHVPVYAAMEPNGTLCVFYNKTNLDVPVLQILKQDFPHLEFEPLAATQDFSERPVKRIKLDSDVEMTPV